MAHWFHRNPLKATSVANFELKLINAETQAIQLCSELRSARTELLNLLPDTSNPGSTVDAALRKYLELLMGFIETPREDANVGDKLRWSLRFRWTHSVLGGTPEAQNDVMFEAVSIILNVAIWFMKNAARLASNETISMDEAKFVHSGLRKAAGLFTFVETRLLRQLPHNPVPGGDLDPRVLTAYLNQCTAEAQEVTIARAIELKHKPSLVSALAHETHQLFTKAAVGLATLDQNVFGQWLTYLKLKALIYHAMAFCYTGENLLSEDKCGLAVRSLQESKKKIAEATELCKTYSKAKGPGSSTVAKPAQHAFFRKLTATITRIAEKCERENGLIYHEKVPFDPPALELKATYGLVAPEEFQVPPVSPMWTPFVYRAVDVSKIFDNAMNKKSEGNIDPVREVPIAANGKDPENESGCVIS